MSSSPRSIVHRIQFWKGERAVESVLTAISLALIFVLAVFARITPAKYAFQIAEVDPWFYYYSANYMLVHGFSAWFHWTNPLEFYPYGLFVPAYYSPVLPSVSVGVYQFLRIVGVSMSFYNFAVEFPVVMTAISSVMMYFLGKEVGGKKTGLLAALLLALSPANIQQTMLGDFKDEFLAFFFIVPGVYFLIRSLRTRRSFDMLASGFFISLTVMTWEPVGPYWFDMVALIVFVGVLARKLSPTVSLKLLSFIAAPSLLVSTMLLRTVGGVDHLGSESPVIGAFLVSVVVLVYDNVSEKSKVVIKALSVFLVAGILVAMGLLLHSGTQGRILAIIDPFYRSSIPIVNTVAENELTTWFSFYAGFNVQMLLIPIAGYLLYKRGDMIAIAMVLFLITATYFTASYVRSEEILTPFAAVASAYVVSRLIDAYAPVLVKAYRRHSAARGSPTAVDWEIGGILIVLILLSGTFFAYQGLTSAYAPPLLMTVGNSVSDSWGQALLWISQNTPQNSVVAAWWDYGYWILVLGNRATLADPSTVNTTQIQYLAIALMSNSTVAQKIFGFYHADYVLVYQPVGQAQGGLEYPTLDGDLGKSTAMLTIAASTNFVRFNKVFGLNLSKSLYSNQSYYITQLPNGLVMPSGKYATNALLYNLIFGPNQALQSSMSQFASFYGASFGTYQVPSGFNLVYESSDQAVLVYQINYAS